MIGGFAAVAHGVTLLTQDVDVCCRLGVDNLLRIQRALADLLDPRENKALVARARAVLKAGRFPEDTTGHRYPWPLV